ncbi:MAG: hypothetical protein AAB358_02575 [Patescibacteria group bacterium]
MFTLIACQTRVRNRKTGQEGVVCPSNPTINDSPDGVLVVYDGTTCCLEDEEGDLEVLGPEEAKADMSRCGGGKGEECCIFIVMNPEPGCQRHGDLRWTLMFRKMGAQRHPSEPFPNCQLPLESLVETSQAAV